MRTLAKLVKLGCVSKHPNADRLCISQVGGWTVIVPLGSTQHDEGVYFEIDSVLPEADWTSHLPNRTIKTINLRGVLSQGLFLNKRDVPALSDIAWVDGKDVTDLLGVVKRDDPQDHLVVRNPVAHGGTQATPFKSAMPAGPPKTAEDRIQSNEYLLDMLSGCPYYTTLKYDGCSATFGFSGLPEPEFRVLSRNFLVDDRDSVYWYIANLYGLPRKLSHRREWLVQGEIIGPKINCNLLDVVSPELRVFDVWDSGKGRYLDFAELVDAVKVLNEVGEEGRPLEMVQVVDCGNEFEDDIKSLLAKAEGNYEGTKNPREGIVVRSRNAPRVSFKVINNKYLLRNGL